MTPEELPRPRPRVLVVDDDRDSVTTLAALLSDAGYDVRVSYSGAWAVVVARHFRPHAILLDIGLPDIKGWDVAREVAKEHERDVPLLIAVSGVYKSEADKVLAQSAGFSHYLTKPYEPAALLALLEPLKSS